MIFSTCRSEIASEEGVLVLTDANFDEAIKANNFLLVEFYAPWCGHCKKLAPEYVKAAATLAKEDPPLYIAKVDATAEKEIAKKFEIQGYPTLKFFVNGVPSEYTGGRTDSEIVSWIRKKTGPPSKEFTTPADVEKWSEGQDVSVVFFGKNEALFKVYESVARGNEELSFAHCSADECKTHFNAADGQVTLFKKFDDKRNDLTGDFDAEKLNSFVNKNSVPLVMKFDEKCAQVIFGKATPGLFFYRDPNSENAKSIEELAANIATKVDKIKVIVTGITEGLEQRLAEYIGVTAADLPTVRIHDTRSDLRKYNLDGEINEENVLQFVNDWEAGKLKPHLKSDPVPEKNDEPVKVIVGKSFHDYINDPNTSVFIKFYAPWCGHCKKLAPIWDELAAKLKDAHPDIVIGKMDSTQNEVEEVSIQGFPTLKFWAKGKKGEAMDYNGGRELKDFEEFLEKNHPGFKKEDL
jgi:protein disulfide-isomerase A1